MSETSTTAGKGSPISADELMNLYYLPMRSALLEAAAGLDRVQRAGGDGALADPRFQALRACSEILATESPERADRILAQLSVD